MHIRNNFYEFFSRPFDALDSLYVNLILIILNTMHNIII